MSCTCIKPELVSTAITSGCTLLSPIFICRHKLSLLWYKIQKWFTSWTWLFCRRTSLSYVTERTNKVLRLNTFILVIWWVSECERWQNGHHVFTRWSGKPVNRRTQFVAAKIKHLLCLNDTIVNLWKQMHTWTKERLNHSGLRDTYVSD